jgi:putative membrane protein
MIFYCILGIISGIFTGLIPGLHTNNIALLFLASPVFGQEFMVFLLSMSITHSFVDFIPSVFIGAPSEDTFESILPAHQLFIQGRAFEAVCLTVLGGVIALFGSLLIAPIFFVFIQQNTDAIIFLTPTILFLALGIIFFSEKNKWLTGLIILSAATQGFFFNGQIFPLITGFFGLPTILLSLKKPNNQIVQSNNFSFDKEIIKEGFFGVIGGAIVSVIPGVGNNIAAAIIKLFRNETNSKKYLVVLGSINTSNFFFSFIVLFAISKTRNGVMIALNEKMFFTPEIFFLGLLIMLFSGCVAAIITIIFSKKATLIFTGKKILFGTSISLFLIITLVFVFNGVIGIVTLFFSTATGLLAIMTGTKRTCCMSSLIIPTLFFYVFYLI